jgi:eukaryotic-like serine/threonine-protein kinase
MSADFDRSLDDDWIIALRDRYAVTRELGRGGMAIVYLVRDLRHNRDVALKMLLPDVTATVGRDRFLQEVAVTARLQHPHILPVFDSGESAGRIWYTMPYVDGETLRARLDRERSLPVDTAVQIATEVASALAYAHAAGIVHRDIKPENLLLSRQGNVMVADFGIAKALDSDARLTETGMSLGTPGYMPLEQLVGERPVRPQADVYALGMILFEMLTGTRPYGTLAPAQMVAALLSTGTPSVATLRREVPAEIDRLVSDALHAEPAHLPASGTDFLARLKAVPSGAQADARGARQTPARRSQRRWLLAAGGRYRRAGRHRRRDAL